MAEGHPGLGRTDGFIIEQIKQRGEIEIGAFAQVEAQVDRF